VGLGVSDLDSVSCTPDVDSGARDRDVDSGDVNNITNDYTDNHGVIIVSIGFTLSEMSIQRRERTRYDPRDSFI
jgi:hypothetical protein